VEAFGVLPIVTFAGSVSVNAMPLSATALAAVFATVIVKTEVPPTVIGVGLKALLNVTFGALTASVAVAADVLVAPCVLVSALAGIVLRKLPGVPDVTFTVIVQLAPAPTLPPVNATLDPPAAAEAVPLPHVVEAFGVLPIVTFAGSVSVNAMPVSATALAAVFATVIVKTEVPPTEIGVGLKALVNVTFGALTASVAVAALVLVAPCVLVSALAGIVLRKLPGVPDVTFTVIVQLAPAPTLPPVNATLDPPAAAEAVPLPHVVEAFGVLPIVTLAGSVSVNAMPVSATALAAVFATVIVKTDVPPTVIGVGLNALVSVRFGALTASVAVAAAALVAPCVLVSALAGIVFSQLPGVELVTLTLIVQLAPAPTLPPVSARLDPPAVADAEPLPHVVAAFGVLPIVTFAGKLSVKATPVSATALAAVLASVTVRTDVPPTVIGVGLNALVNVTSGALTTSVAVAAAALVAPCVLVSALAGIVFSQLPGVELVTLTVMVQLAPAATLPPLSPTLEPPAVADAEPLPHVVAAFGVLPIVTFAGKLSVKATPVSATAFAAVFATVTVKTDVPPTVIGVGLNDLLNVTSGALTTSDAVAADALDAPCALVSALAGIVLSQLPGVELVTLTVIVQLAPAPTLPPVKARFDPPAAADAVPLPHVVAAFGVVPIVTFAGSVSVNATPVSATAFAAVLATVTVRTDVPPTVIGVGLKAFVNVTSGALTASVAVAADAFDAPCVLVSALAGIVLSQLPGVALVTLTVIVQLAPAPTAPPVRATLGPPAVAEAVPLPHVVAAFGVVPIVTFAGSVSVNATPVSATAFAAVLATVTVRTDVPPTVIGVGLKAFVNVTSGALTASVAVAADAFDAPCVLVSALAGIVLSQLPGVELVTLTVIVQLAPAATLPPVKATLGPPAVAEAVPLPHVVAAFGVLATVTLAGSVSVKATPLSATAFAAVLATVTVRTDVPPTVIGVGLNALLKVTSGALTVKVAVAAAVLVPPCVLVTAPAGTVFR
jgi:hypothetical protein